MTRPSSQVSLALYLADLGLNNCQIGRITGIPRGTIRDWRRAKRLESNRDRYGCPVCGSTVLDAGWYAYLLGMYLGDGYIVRHRSKDVYRLRISLDQKYPGIIRECEQAVSVVRNDPSHKVGLVPGNGKVDVSAWWKHWPCLFPQHGPGPKHLRSVALCAWQQEIADSHPDRLLRGLIHSDGCRGMNRVNGKGYPRYQFSNRSDDIRAIFCEACDRYGVAWRQSNRVTISVSRASEVAKMDRIVGPKI